MNTVLAIQAVLQDAEEQQVENHQVKHWLMNLRDAVYDADDLLSEFTTHVLQQKAMDGDKIAMRERFNDISNDRDQFQLKLVGCPLETRVVTRGRDQSHSFVPDEEVIGGEKDKQAIIDLLLDFDVEDNVSFISIVGIGGLGKTALAQYVFNDEKVQANFELKIWVCVSDVFDIKTIVEMIIGSTTGRKPKNLNMDPLQNELRRTLSQKKYLLILDDVWNEDSENWCNLKRLLMGGAKGSFIQSSEESHEVEHVANEYFMELLWRSFFQEAKEDGGMNRRFKMHDLIHDLAAHYVSETDCILVDSNAKNVKEKGHHLSFPFYNISFFEENLSTLVKANKIQTFILAYNKWKYDQGTIEESTLKKLISTFRYLRALDLHGLNMRMLPNTIGTLMHLKYLDLSSNDIGVLPSSITKLVNLQTLKLCQCKKLRELTVDIQKLVSLKHLDIDGCENLTHMPCGLEQLTSLQTLTLFVVSKDPVSSSKHCGGLAELNKLNDLRGKLEIKNLARLKDATPEFKVANLKEKQRLSELILQWNLESDDSVDASDDENSMDSLQPHEHLKSLKVDGYMGVRVSSWLSFLTNLVELSIRNCKKCQYLPPLYQLSSLRELDIWDMDGLEYMTNGDMNDEISTSLALPSTFFPSLETLELDCPRMTCMPLFPNLERGLWLNNSSLKALEVTIEMKMMNNTGGRASSFPSSSSSSSSSSTPPLSKLKYLRLLKIQELESLLEESFKNLTSLERLQIWLCPNLTSLLEGMSESSSSSCVLEELEDDSSPVPMVKKKQGKPPDDVV
uniref:Uncharacterized protein n=1 Tax=Quercus lobata TaxID=97700 RepID=A0A7N2MVT4_QUELO